MSIYYEAASDISPENLTSGELMDKTPAPLKNTNRRYQQTQEDEEENEIWKFCEEVNNRGTYGLTRHTSDVDGLLTKKNKSLSDAEVKRKKKEIFLKFYAVKVGKKRGIYGDWDSAKEQISGYPNGTCKKFNTMEEAVEFMGDIPKSKKKTQFKKEEEESASDDSMEDYMRKLGRLGVRGR